MYFSLIRGRVFDFLKYKTYVRHSEYLNAVLSHTCYSKIYLTFSTDLV